MVLFLIVSAGAAPCYELPADPSHPQESLQAVAASPDGAIVAVGSRDNRVQIWKDGKPHRLVDAACPYWP